jgi:hypothetical protein
MEAYWGDWAGALPSTPVYKCHQMSVSRLFWLFLSNPLSHRIDFVAKPFIPIESSRRDESNGVRFTMGGVTDVLETCWVAPSGTYTPVAPAHRPMRLNSLVPTFSAYCVGKRGHQGFVLCERDLRQWVI